MAAFVPKTYTNGKRTEVANSAIEEANLKWAGWWVVGTYTPTPESAFSADQLTALRAAYDARAVTAPTKFPGIGRFVTIDRHPGAFFFGANLGFGPTSTSSTVFWEADWNWDGVVKPRLDKMAAGGMNATRVQGSYAAYTANPTQYKARYVQAMEYCRAVGLKVLYCLLNNFNDTLDPALRNSYKAMAADLCGPYAGDPLLIGWDIGNEMNCEGSSTINTVCQNLTADLRVIDPTTKITVSGIAYLTQINSGHVSAVDSYVDFHDVHLYATPGAPAGSDFAPFTPNWLDDVRRVTDKPFIIGEFGANRNGTEAYDPHLPDDYAQAQYYKALRRYAIDGVMGMICWEIQDDNSDNQFGLYDVAGNPRPALAEVLAYPSVRMDVVQDAIGYRMSPVVLHDFARADSSGSIGAAPIGGAAVVTAGTWGIASRRGKVITPSGNNQNVIAWEANSCDVFAEVEYIPGSPVLAGMAVRVVDASNFIDISFDSGSGHINVHSYVDGTGTLIGTVATSSLIGLARIGAYLRGQTLALYAYDRLIGTVSLASISGATATGTKHGLYQYTGIDTTTVFNRFSVKVAARTY